MYLKVITSLCKRIANQQKNNVDTVIFLSRFTCLPTCYVPIETSSKVPVGPLASGDPQVILSHVECLPQALALDPTGPLVALRVSLY